MINDGLVVIAFVECRLIGNWKQMMPHPGTDVLVHQAQDDKCEVNLIQIEIHEKRRISFEKDAKLNIINNTVVYNEKFKTPS